VRHRTRTQRHASLVPRVRRPRAADCSIQFAVASVGLPFATAGSAPVLFNARTAGFRAGTSGFWILADPNLLLRPSSLSNNAVLFFPPRRVPSALASKERRDSRTSIDNRPRSNFPNPLASVLQTVRSWRDEHQRARPTLQNFFSTTKSNEYRWWFGRFVEARGNRFEPRSCERQDASFHAAGRATPNARPALQIHRESVSSISLFRSPSPLRACHVGRTDRSGRGPGKSSAFGKHQDHGHCNNVRLARPVTEPHVGCRPRSGMNVPWSGRESPREFHNVVFAGAVASGQNQSGPAAA